MHKLLTRYLTMRRFLPTFWRTLDFESTPGGRPTLQAVQFLQRIEGRPRASMQSAPRAVISRPWQRYVLPRGTSAEDGQRTPRVDRPAYTVCVVERLHEALRRHDIYVEPSERWGDARAKLLQPEQWEGIRAQICQALGRELVASRALEQLGQQVEEAYRRVMAHLPSNTALQIEQQDGEDVPNLERLERVAEPESLRMLLELFGYEVTVAHSGPEGVAAALRARPDVVLCDIGLPGMDGFAVAGALRDDPATAAARLIAVTGYGQEDDRRRALAAGFDEHLVKPVDPEILLGRLAPSSQ